MLLVRGGCCGGVAFCRLPQRKACDDCTWARLGMWAVESREHACDNLVGEASDVREAQLITVVRARHCACRMLHPFVPQQTCCESDGYAWFRLQPGATRGTVEWLLTPLALLTLLTLLAQLLLVLVVPTPPACIQWHPSFCYSAIAANECRASEPLPGFSAAGTQTAALHPRSHPQPRPQPTSACP